MSKFALPYETPLFWSLYSLGEPLGDDDAAHVCHDKSTGDEYACKSIPKSSAAGAWTEIQILHRLSRLPGAVAFRDAYEDSRHVHLVTELCDGGGLLDRVAANPRHSERDAVRFMRPVVEFVESCHSLGVMHRGLRPGILVFKTRDPGSVLKVSDCGSAAFFRPGDRFRDTVGGSPYYVAPEVLKRKYGPEADIWSLGIILYILLSGFPPFWADTKQGTHHEILNATLDLESQHWSHVSDDAKDLLRKMLDKNPKKRLSAYYVLCHPWMADEGDVPDRPLHSARLRLEQFLDMDQHY